MRHILILLLLLLLLPIPTVANADVYGAKNSQDRVVNLPQDAGRWYVTLFGDVANAKYQEVKGWLQTNPQLKHLVSQCHFNEYATTDIRFLERYAATMPGLPCIRLQSSGGQVVSEWWGHYIPATPQGLYAGIRDDLLNPEHFNRCPLRRPCPKPQPHPEPEPKPEPKPEPIIDTPPVIDPPPVEPTPEPAKSKLPPCWALLGAVLVGSLAGVVQEWQKLYFSGSTSSRF